MHWLVEVSRAGDTSPSERYCIDARRWQSALQEARRLRGDSGPLPKLTIELTDSGYRAIDPELRVRYVVSEAPPGMPLTDGARALLSTHPPPVDSMPPAKGAATTSVAISSGAAANARASIPSAKTPVSGTPIGSVPAASEPATAQGATSGAAATPQTTTTGAPPSVLPPRTKSTPPAPVNPAAFTAATSWPPLAEATGGAANTSPLAVEGARAADAPSPALGSAPPPAATTSSVPPPSCQVIRQREEKPTPASPLAYRELALAVKAGTSRAEVEALLLSRLDEIRGTLPADARKFVQLAVFDHVFVKRPMRQPLGTLVWKDWRGDPALSFPGFGEIEEGGPPSSLSSARMPSWSASMMTSVRPVSTFASEPPAAASNAPVTTSAAPIVTATPAAAPTSLAASAAPVHPGVASPGAPIVPSPVTRVSQPPTATLAPAPQKAGTPSGAPPSGSLTPARVVSVGPSKPPPATTSAPPPAASGALTTTLVMHPEAAAQQRPSSNPPLPLTSVRAPSEPAPAARALDRLTPVPGSTRRSEPPHGRRSDPPSRRSDPSLVRRRSPGEDLIGELFERMHELTFMGDIPSGADYVLNVLFDFIPCEAMLVHVFDLGRREFVVVRAHGPSMRNALLYRTPDTDPLVLEVMRRQSLVMNGVSPLHSPAFDRLGIEAKQIMSGAVRQGGRYLGLIEIANPFGGTPFHEGEKNAFEYVCEQFAEFVASHPLVLDEDIILRA